jgi:hypothetical protein
MTSTAAHIRNAGAHSADWLAAREARKAERIAALEARIAATDPALREAAEKAVNRSRRR